MAQATGTDMNDEMDASSWGKQPLPTALSSLEWILGERQENLSPARTREERAGYTDQVSTGNRYED